MQTDVERPLALVLAGTRFCSYCGFCWGLFGCKQLPRIPAGNKNVPECGLEPEQGTSFVRGGENLERLSARISVGSCK